MANLYSGEDRKKKRKSKKIIKSFIIISLFLVCNFIMFYLGNILAIKGVLLKNVPTKTVSDLGKIQDAEKYENLFGLRTLLLSKYDGEIDDQKLLEGAMRGMAAAIGDPYTVYMNSEEYKVFMESSSGSFYGIGAQLGVKDDKITIIAPVEGSPAEKAGLKAGDVILKVDDFVITEPNTETVVSKVRGEQGEPVKLTIQRNNEEPFVVEIIRDEIKNESVKGEMLDKTVGYIQITTFSDEEVSNKFKEKLNELKSSGMQKLILDLRGNPGGYLSECVKIASQFIPKGEVVTYTVDKYEEKQVSKSEGGDAIGMPLVVLVDGGSASASEVVTGALKDHKVATIIGITTFGKGIVQQLLPLPNNLGGLKVTTSKYYCPNGENIHHVGIVPDITVEIPKEILNKPYDRDIDPQFQKALEVIKEKTS